MGKVVHKFNGNPSNEELVLTLSKGKTAVTILCRPGWQFEEGVFEIDDEGQTVTCKQCLAALKKEASNG